MKWLFFFLLGFGTVYLLKYVVFGLYAWNRAFHPGRIEHQSTLFYFGKPFFGVFN
jgi:hypothetical protein